MNALNDGNPIILVLEDVEETRDGIEALLKRDGYRVQSARDEEDATERARSKRPDLLLVSLSGLTADVIAAARRVRKQADLGEEVPVVIFCGDKISEGEEVAVGRNLYLSCPDNFDQLRNLIGRLLLRMNPLRLL